MNISWYFLLVFYIFKFIIRIKFVDLESLRIFLLGQFVFRSLVIIFRQVIWKKIGQLFFLDFALSGWELLSFLQIVDSFVMVNVIVIASNLLNSAWQRAWRFLS